MLVDSTQGPLFIALKQLVSKVMPGVSSGPSVLALADTLEDALTEANASVEWCRTRLGPCFARYWVVRFEDGLSATVHEQLVEAEEGHGAPRSSCDEAGEGACALVGDAACAPGCGRLLTFRPRASTQSDDDWSD
jgi:hypothetical protein